MHLINLYYICQIKTIFSKGCLFLFQVALSYKNQILGYIDSYIARTRYLVNYILSKSYNKQFMIGQTQCKTKMANFI